MKFFKKLTWAVIGLIGLGVIAGIALRSNHGLQDIFVERALSRLLAPQASQSMEFGGDNLDVVFCGTASPMGNSDRAQQCIAVLAGDRFFIVDSGARSTANVGAAALPVQRLDGVLLTHFHSDHISSLGELHLASWVRGRPGKMSVYGGPGVSQVVDGFNLAYGLDYQYRTAHHGEALMPAQNAGLQAISFMPPEQGMVTIYDQGGVVISAFSVPHAPVKPAVGYRFDYGGRSVVISGDTSKSVAVEEAARNADVLIHEVLDPHLVAITASVLKEAEQEGLAQVITDTLDYHTSPREVVETAEAAGVDMVVFTHFAPSPANQLVERFFTRDINTDGLQPVLADDGMWLRLPSGSSQIIQSTLFN